MPSAVMVIVGGPDGAGAGAGEGNGVAAPGVGVGAVAPPEHAAAAISTMNRQRLRSTAPPTITEGALRTRVCLFYPCLNVAIGSTEAARRAGSKHANRATTHSSAGTAANVSGSNLPTP